MGAPHCRVVRRRRRASDPGRGAGLGRVVQRKSARMQPRRRQTPRRTPRRDHRRREVAPRSRPAPLRSGATVASTSFSLSRPKTTEAEGLEGGRLVDCNGTPAAICRPTPANFLPDAFAVGRVADDDAGRAEALGGGEEFSFSRRMARRRPSRHEPIASTVSDDGNQRRRAREPHDLPTRSSSSTRVGHVESPRRDDARSRATGPSRRSRRGRSGA